MFIPRYWSEAARRETLADGRQVTLRRFGWSSESQHDADVAARRRVEDAFDTLRAGGEEALADLARRERKVAYAGTDGLPIREEIVREEPDLDVVLTRNSYGATCLNTPHALFVDVDEEAQDLVGVGCAAALFGALLGAVLGVSYLDLHAVLGALLGALLLSSLVVAAARLRARRSLRHRDLLRWTLGRLGAWCVARPDWRLAVYQTPAGVRLLALHAPFDANDEQSFALMEHLDADPLYVRMCRLQKCFRARVSPKPWRTSWKERFRPGGTWPVTDPARLEARARWLEGYGAATRDLASCRRVAEVGTGTIDPRIAPVQRLHDELCRALSRLPLA